MLTKETQRETRKVASFLEELKNFSFSKVEVGYIRIKISDYEKMKDRIEELEKEILLKNNQSPEKND
jgi:inorganic pyrophosphatase/exopolyphosphatase